VVVLLRARERRRGAGGCPSNWIGAMEGRAVVVEVGVVERPAAPVGPQRRQLSTRSKPTSHYSDFFGTPGVDAAHPVNCARCRGGGVVAEYCGARRKGFADVVQSKLAIFASHTMRRGRLRPPARRGPPPGGRLLGYCAPRLGASPPAGPRRPAGRSGPLSGARTRAERPYHITFPENGNIVYRPQAEATLPRRNFKRAETTTLRPPHFE